MSAWVVSLSHIDALVTEATTNRNGGWLAPLRDKSPGVLGQILLTENYRSVNNRYREDDKAPAYDFQPYTAHLSAVTIIKLCDCFHYQACETDDYENTEAWRIVNAIRECAIDRLPGYDAAPWGLDGPRSGAVSIFDLARKAG